MNDKIELKLSNVLTHLDVLFDFNKKYFIQNIVEYENFVDGISDNGDKIFKIIENCIILLSKDNKLFNYSTYEKNIILNSWNKIKNSEVEKNFFLNNILQKNIEYRNNIDFMLFFENQYVAFNNSDYMFIDADYGDLIDELDNYQKYCKRKKLFPTFPEYKYWVWDRVL